MLSIPVPPTATHIPLGVLVTAGQPVHEPPVSYLFFHYSILSRNRVSCKPGAIHVATSVLLGMSLITNGYFYLGECGHYYFGLTSNKFSLNILTNHVRSKKVLKKYLVVVAKM